MSGTIAIIEDGGNSGEIQYDECMIFVKKNGVASYYTIPEMSEEEEDTFMFSLIKDKQ